MAFRIFVEKRKDFDVASAKALREIQSFLPLDRLKIYNVYDVFGLEENQKEPALSVLIDRVTDKVHDQMPTDEKSSFFAVEYLPGQYDQRADWAAQSMKLVVENANIEIRSALLYEFEKLNSEDLQSLKKYLINSVDSREKDLSHLRLPSIDPPKEVPIVVGFTAMNKQELASMHQEWEFAFDLDDLHFIQSYFQKEKREPTETELKVLDTYWSDHCRHTTFMTELNDIEIEGTLQKEVESAFQKYLNLRQELGRTEKPISLMDIGTIVAKKLKQEGKLNDWVISEEINACTIEIEVDVEGQKEEWYLLFKNETHNHPTEIEPFGGASTCLGGAIRDPLSGRAFVYQAMRVTGSANPLEKIENTLEGKLPQKKITQSAALGFSSYGNQIGLATTQVAEIYDEGYKAKRMEVGFVAGAVPKDWVRRETPQNGDVIVLLGGKTGRDGVGGATGSSKVQTEDSITTMSAEVQKGDAVEERKIQRLFRKKEVCQLIKRCNDFGAGGVSVAIGEIAESISIDLDAIPVKYEGLNGTELAISESQERMALVIEAKDLDFLKAEAAKENLIATKVAEVTQNGSMQMFWKGNKIVDLKRSFLNTAGTPKHQSVRAQTNIRLQKNNFEKLSLSYFQSQLSRLNVASQKGLIEHFDSHVGQSTVLMPLGGKTQRTPSLCSVQTLSIQNQNTTTVSLASWGFSTHWALTNPYLMGHYSVIESVAKIIVSGGKLHDIRLSFQEYFERLHQDPLRWGKPFQALLGALEAQLHFEIGAIGGKDSMSGTFKELSVPPTLISFACAKGNLKNIISPEFKKADNYIYLFHHSTNEHCIPNYKELKNAYRLIENEIEKENILAAQTIGEGGLATALFKMATGNEIGASIQTSYSLWANLTGSILIESLQPIEGLEFLGKTENSHRLTINGESFELSDLNQAWMQRLAEVFPITTPQIKKLMPEPKIYNAQERHSKLQSDQVQVFLPLFPGTNSEYETQKVFEEEGAVVQTELFLNYNDDSARKSILNFTQAIEKSHIIVFSGGFSAGDEPDGSAKFIVAVLHNPIIKKAITNFLEKGGLILGICNGFQALIKSGLLPYGEISEESEGSPTLTYNQIGRHINQMAQIQVVSNKSPWLKGMQGQKYWIPFSHGEGRFFAHPKALQDLIEKGQICTQYVDKKGRIALNMPDNPNGSVMGIEGICDPSGQIYGRMGHPERYRNGLMKNIPDIEYMNIFRNGVEYIQQSKK